MTIGDPARQAASEMQAAGDPWHRAPVAAVLVAGTAAALTVGFIGLPRELARLPGIALHALQIAEPVWGTTETVNEIVYGSRGFDTFGETFLLLAAVISVTTLARSRERRTEYVGEASAGLDEQAMVDPEVGAENAAEQTARYAEEGEEGRAGRRPYSPDRHPLGERTPERAEAMTVIVRVAARTAAVILAVASVYLAAWGFSPGGGFPAGAALAGVVVLLYTALGRRPVRPAISPTVLEPVEMAGAAAIIAIGVIGLLRRGSLFANWVPLAQMQTIRAGGTEQLYSGAELIEVATGLIIAIFALLTMTHGWSPDEQDDPGNEGEHGEPGEGGQS
jgi:multicomponent Na+:H+ antiporter subunit B